MAVSFRKLKLCSAVGKQLSTVWTEVYIFTLKGIVWLWGCMTYSSTVCVLLTVDGVWRNRQCIAVKLILATFKKSVLESIVWIFSRLYCAVRDLFLRVNRSRLIHLCSSKTPRVSFDKSSYFTWQTQGFLVYRGRDRLACLCYCVYFGESELHFNKVTQTN